MATTLGKGAAFGGSPLPKLAGMASDVTADINVTPMIDVMLVLLIIFMVVTPAAGLQAVLPKAAMSAPAKEKRVTLGIDQRGRYFINDKPVPEAQLQTRFQEEYARRPGDHILYLKADQGIAYSYVLTGINAARQAGITKVGAITELPKGARMTPSGGK